MEKEQKSLRSDLRLSVLRLKREIEEEGENKKRDEGKKVTTNNNKSCNYFDFVKNHPHQF